METKKLQELLGRLHSELADHQIDDPKVQQQLKTLLLDIQNQVTNSQQTQLPQAQNASDFALLLSAQFPRLSSTIREIADQLGKMGI
ncbi:MAG: DUF4404 family protein [Oceanospirillaceae bacterium]|jgi:GTP1/Obg family GTP-binding protein|nr:DUF4404 family protein [Oceanospirillaceae bacterium]MBT4442438.1 DUF4404 family protein [Oceanospirillaceae bacterium]MBT6076837.1 DUF4404 family protein [Oceanospirillaceae bacterium]HIG36223.1 DUF4404 family protein [Oceanospirillaceae bacterium]